MDLEAILRSVRLLSRMPPPTFTEALFGSPSLVLASKDASKLSQSSSSLFTSSSACNPRFTATGDVAFAKALGQRRGVPFSARKCVGLRSRQHILNKVKYLCLVEQNEQKKSMES